MPDRAAMALKVAEAALTVPAENRQGFIDQECAGDDALRCEVEILLEQDTDGLPFLASEAGVAFEIGMSLPKHATLGAYRVVEQIGCGGMGEVYRANRIDGSFEQDVAIKVLAVGRHGGMWRQRFNLERRLLARLRHPNICSILDGGTIPDDGRAGGRPYFVMELIDGLPLDAYCLQRGLGVSDRLKLFTQVCATVQFAHRNLVVHRDLKPSNILVTQEGTPKLLDFGVAKLLDPMGDGATTRWPTAFTPAYASPEQLAGEVVSTSSDVYSLGVVLHELLVGRRPFDFEAGLPPAEIRKLIIDGQGESIRSALQKTRDAAAKERFSVLRRDQRLDLEKLTSKALRVDPSDRYGSAEALREEVERFLTGRPVEAAAPSIVDRCRKLVLRHRGASLAAAAVFVMAIVFVWGIVDAHRAALEARNRAERVVTLLVDVFRTSDPYEHLGRRISARQALDGAASRIKADSDLTPEVRSELLDALGQIQLHLGEYDTAGNLFKEALELRQTSGSSKVGASLHQMGKLRLRQNNYAAAEKLLFKALDTHRSTGAGKSQLARAGVLLDLGQAARHLGRFEDAERRYAEALLMLEAGPDAGVRELTDAWLGRGRLRLEQGQFDEAETMVARAMQLSLSTLGKDHPEVATVATELGLLYQELGRHHDALASHQRALSIKRRVFGAGHPEVARSLHNSAITLVDLGRYAEAEEAYREALEIEQALFGAGDPETATTMVALGTLYLRWGKTGEAEALLTEALAMQRQRLGPEHPKVALVLARLGQVREEQGQYDDAIALLTEALAIQERALPSPHPRMGGTYNNLAKVLDGLGRLDEARAAYEASLQHLSATKGEQHPDYLAVYNNLARLKVEQGDLVEALAIVSQILETRRQILGDGHLDVANSLNSVGSILIELERFSEALPLFEQSYEIVARTVGERHPILATLLHNRGRALIGAGKPAEAEGVLREALDMREEFLGASHPSLGPLLIRLAELLEATGRKGEGEQLRVRAEGLISTGAGRGS